MADFLTNILARTFNHGQKLERRLPSMFEPTKNSHPASRVVDLPLEELTQELERPVRPMRWEKSSPQRIVPASMIEELPASTLEQPVRVLPTSVPQPTFDVDHSVARHMEPAPTLEQPIRVLPTKAPQPTFDVDRSVARHVGPPLPASIKEIIVERETENKREVVHTERKRSIAEKSRIVARVPIEHVARQEVLVDHTIALPAFAAPNPDTNTVRGSVAVPTRVRPENSVIRSERRQQITSTAVPEPPIPTISITIGRVEIRATPPSAAVQRSGRANRPKLSLEDYLLSRNGAAK